MTEPTEQAPGEGPIGETAQALGYNLISCPTDVYTFFPTNHYSHHTDTGWKTGGCVSYFINRNMNIPANSASESYTYANFPQYEGAWSATKEAQCRNSLVEVRIAKRQSLTSAWDAEYVEGWGMYASPTFEYIPGTNVKVRIKSCTAMFRRAPSQCSWYPDRNLLRIDVLAIPNGQLIPGPARVRATFAHDNFC